MVAGIVFQLASILVFTTFFIYVLYRAKNLGIQHLNNPRVRWIVAATAFSVTCVVIRSIYRTIEMLQGWRGYLMTTERYFIALDGSLMVAAVAIFNVINPGWSEGATSWGSRRMTDTFLAETDKESTEGRVTTD
jgi:O-antigen/teichoic acid export membrane protein